MGLFKKIKNALSKTRDSIKKKFDYIFRSGEINEDFYDELEETLITSDVGVNASLDICEELRHIVKEKKLKRTEDALVEFKEIISSSLEQNHLEIEYPAIITIIGVNGVGKTTSIGKMTQFFKSEHKSVTLVAGDTFRAAAAEQLSVWADRNNVKIIKQTEGVDAGSVVFDGISSAKAKKTDVLLIDTAGRLHTKNNLMEELAKINRIIEKENTFAKHYTFFVLDATTGQNGISQVKSFNQYVKIDGIILTKLDGTAKGGVVIGISKELNLPVVFVGVGEQIDDLELFDAKEFTEQLF